MGCSKAKWWLWVLSFKGCRGDALGDAGAGMWLKKGGNRLLSGVKAELTCPLPLSPNNTDLARVVVRQCYLTPAFPHWLPRLRFFCKISTNPVVRMLSHGSIGKHASIAHSNPGFTCVKVLFVKGRCSTQILIWPCPIYRLLQTLQGDDWGGPTLPEMQGIREPSLLEQDCEPHASFYIF